MPAKPLTKEQLADAEKLKRRFDLWQATAKTKTGKRPSQLYAAQELEITQGGLNQYLNGRIPLNVDISLKFAKLLDCKVTDFSESINKEINLLLEQYLPASSSRTVSEKPKEYINRPEWPFQRISPERYYGLITDTQRLAIEEWVDKTITHFSQAENNQIKSKANN